MVGVYLRNNERNVCAHTKCGAVRDNGATGFGELRLKFTGNVRIERGEDDAREFAAGEFWLVRLQNHLRDVQRDGGIQLPLTGFRERFPGAAITRGEPGNVEPGMICEQLNEALADHAGRAKNTYVTPFHNLSRITHNR